MTPATASEMLPSAEARELVRQRWLERGGFYNPWLHLAITSVFGGGLVIAGIALLHEVRWWQVLFGLGLFVLSNAFEWRFHRDLLHKRVRPFAYLFEQHTPNHHRVFIAEDMSIRNVREFRMVLMPAYAIVLAFVGLTPVMVLLWIGGHHNLAAVFAIETMGYIVTYEWLHLSYHLPPDSFIGRRRLVRWLKQHHALHHDPRLMQKWNFNVSLPLWDLVRGTYLREREPSFLERRPVRHPDGN